MSLKEQFYLRKFFKISICDDHFGYVLFFNKPMALSGFFLKCPSHELSHPYSNKLLKKGWGVWKKYAHQIPHEGFIFCEEIKTFFDSVNKHEIKVCSIYLINKKIFKNTVQNNIECFKNRLGIDFSSDDFLKKIETTKSIMPHLQGDETLLGILLGFGKEASSLFHLNKQSSHPILLTALTSDSSRKGKVQPIVFVGDPDSVETQEVIRSYHGLADSVEQLCQRDDILKSVLKRFIQS